MKTQFIFGWALALAVVFFAACQVEPNRVTIEVDGKRQTLTTEGTTVRDALDQAGVELGKLDKVRPDLYTSLEPGLTIVITRVTEELESEQAVIPFEREIVVNEALAPGESRIAQLGTNGTEEITIRVVYEDGEEISRSEVSRQTVVPAIPEIMVVGPAETLPSVQIDGSVAYLSGGNAWLMRSSSRSRRALTTHGKLDGLVFDLSPDGRHLLYTLPLTDEIELPINELWLASTTIVGEPPITVGIRGVLHAEWSPVISPALVAYSTAERTPNAPGWQANNDLWLFSPVDEGPFSEPVEVIPPNTQGLYSWWGTRYTWAPDGTKLAYARPDQIGVVTLITDSTVLSSNITPLIDFAPLQTFSDWVWVPEVSWSPDSRFVAATVHGEPIANEPPEESQVFNLWLFGVDGTLAARVAERVGMWANPVWSEAGIAYGQAVNPLQSVNSRYTIEVIDHDGSNRRQVFPFQDEPGVQFPDMVWSPNQEDLLFVYNGDLHISRRAGSVPLQLSADGQGSQPQWARVSAQIITGTAVFSGVLPATTSTLTASVTPELTATASRPATRTRTPSRTPTASRTPTNTAEATSTTTLTPSSSRTPTATPVTPTRTRAASQTPTLTATASRSPTPTATASRTPTLTATATRTPTLTATASRTPTRTATSSRTPTGTATAGTVTATTTVTPTSSSAGGDN